MRRELHVVALVALAGILARPYAEAQEATPPEETGPPTEETVTGGTLPDDLGGRWLAVGWLPTAQGALKTTTALLEIAQGDDGLVMTQAWVAMPEAMAKVLREANAADEKWEPSPADLTELAESWDGLEFRDPKIGSAKHEIVANDGFDRDFKSEPKTRDAMFAIRQTFNFRRSGHPSLRQINVFGTMERSEAGVYTGNYTTVTIAASFMPIPIKLDGTFGLYRLGDVPAPKGSGGFFDFLKGCGRSS